MRPSAIELLHRSRLGPGLRSAASRFQTRRWRRDGCRPPLPPHLKRAKITALARLDSYDFFIETGTYRGDTTAAICRIIPRCYSIELDETLARLARHRFRRHSGVTIIDGDSAVALPKLVSTLDGRGLIWLDGHFSDGVTARGDTVTPIEAELAAVIQPHQPDHTILIDDARLFDGTGGYPSLETVESLARSIRPSCSIRVVDDVIHVTSCSTGS